MHKREVMTKRQNPLDISTTQLFLPQVKIEQVIMQSEIYM